jgi:hypothetical protein
MVVVFGVTARERTGSLDCVTCAPLEAFRPEASESRHTLELEIAVLEPEVLDSGVLEILYPAQTAPPVASVMGRLAPPVASVMGRLGPPVASVMGRLGLPVASERNISSGTSPTLVYTLTPLLESALPSSSTETISQGRKVSVE